MEAGSPVGHVSVTILRLNMAVKTASLEDWAKPLSPKLVIVSHASVGLLNNVKICLSPREMIIISFEFAVSFRAWNGLFCVDRIIVF